MVCPRALLLVALLAWVGAVTAAGAGPAWGALSAEQRYILQRYESRWASLDAATRTGLVARADALRAASARRAAAGSDDADTDADTEDSAADTADAASPKPVGREDDNRSRKRSAHLTASEALLSAHSTKLKRRLRDIPGLSLAERRDILARWSGLSSRERIELVERYATNPASSEELALQKALREGRLKPEDIQQALLNGQLRPADLSNALSAGQLSVNDVRAALGSDRAAAADIENAARTGQAPSPDSTGAPRPGSPEPVEPVEPASAPPAPAP